MTNHNSKFESVIKHLEITAYKKGIKLGLNRVNKALNDFNNPHKHLKVIHVAGTNGKGSTSIYLARLLEKSGYKVGLFTSPHLCRYTERITINQKEISKFDFIKYLSKTIQKNKYSLTEFEFLTVATILYFKDKKVDWVIMETGLGGRLDATNVFIPKLTIITNISLDHTSILGENIIEIAKEKAGIIKPSVPLITAETNKNIINLFKSICIKKKSPFLTLKKSDYKITKNTYGFHSKNASLDLNAFYFLGKHNLISSKRFGPFDLKINQIPGRFEEIKTNQMHFLLDGAHNEAALKYLKKMIRHFYPNKKIVLILGILKTKNLKKMINIISPLPNTLIATKGEYHLFADSTSLVSYFPKNKKCITTNNLKEALISAKAVYSKNSLIVITGSLYLVGEAKKLLC